MIKRDKNFFSTYFDGFWDSHMNCTLLDEDINNNNNNNNKIFI